MVSKIKLTCSALVGAQGVVLSAHGFRVDTQSPVCPKTQAVSSRLRTREHFVVYTVESLGALESHLGEDGCLILSRSTAKTSSGQRAFQRIVTLVPLVLSLSVHVCELQIFKFAKSRPIRHIMSLYTSVFADCRRHDLLIAHDSYHMLSRTTVHRDPMLL